MWLVCGRLLFEPATCNAADVVCCGFFSEFWRAFMSRSSNSGCRVVRPGDTYAGKQGLNYFEGIAAETVGSKGICMHLLTIPPGARAKAHLHESHETAIYVLAGEAHTWFGDRLEEHVVVKEGEMFYIPAGVPHLPANLSDKPCSAVIARTDPKEQESVVLLPELDALVPA
ncbi:cupin domain-containing protein [Sinorhizobium mexicanum]|uniref:Cupin domain-containing protein n=2 Tax=Sinorhizobium mexicanum TaxID=375549 RepID=A0A859QKN7_9HYPH|nr:cupin domain-containing protein [Sinorhizobium mexicanum]